MKTCSIVFPKLRSAWPIHQFDKTVTVLWSLEWRPREFGFQSGEVASALLPATNIFVRRNDRWLMIHHQSARPPQ